ncbi:MAG: lmo0937 family membrane protein [Candidatus Staskawiczbacteria bacterium]
MLLEIGIVLVVLWLLGFAFYPLGGLIHILLVVAIIAIVWNLISGRKIT